jgi:dephospho-CoA kinase
LRRVKLAQPKRRRRREHNGLRVIGLTGSIAMGKSTAAALLRRLGVPVFDADAAAHAHMGPAGKATRAIAARFPGAVGPEGVNRKALGALVFSDRAALRDLERIVHPLVAADRAAFLKRAALAHRPICAIDVPLLFEGRGPKDYDAVVVVSAPAFLQRQRALARPGMSPERLQGILARQWPDARKRRHADAVVPTGLGKRETLRRLRQFLTLLRNT